MSCFSGHWSSGFGPHSLPPRPSQTHKSSLGTQHLNHLFLQVTLAPIPTKGSRQSIH